MTQDGKDTIDNAEQHDRQPYHEAVKERPAALETVKKGDEIIAQIGNPAGHTIYFQYTAGFWWEQCSGDSLGDNLGINPDNNLF